MTLAGHKRAATKLGGREKLSLRWAKSAPLFFVGELARPAKAVWRRFEISC